MLASGFLRNLKIFYHCHFMIHRKMFFTQRNVFFICILSLSFSTLFSAYSSIHSDLLRAKTIDSQKEIKRYQSKLGSTLSWLMKMRNQNARPEELREVLQKKRIDVSILFEKELNENELKKFETSWLSFKRLPDGSLAKSGRIYGAEIAWENICEFAKKDKVIRIESTWKPSVEYPSGL